MKVTSKINIDLRHPNAGVRVDAVQGDVNTRAVEISLFDGGSAWKVPSGVTAALAYKKPDSQKGCLDDSASVTVSGSTITIVMTKQMLAAPGTVNACVVLTDASQNQLTSFPFSVSVAANPAADAQQSDEPNKVDTSDATAAAADILSGKTAYVKGQKVTGTIVTKTSSDLSSSGATVTVPAGYYAENASKSVSTVTQATPSISVDTSGKITATSEQTAGYVVPGTKSATKQLTTQAAQTITPGTADKTIASGKYLTGAQTVKGDANLVAGNIKSGVSIFGVSGSYEGSGGLDTSDATAAAGDIASGKTAYVNGKKVTGTHKCAAPNLQSKTVSPSESQQTVSPDSGYDGLSSVKVGAVSSTYVGSGVTKKSAATYTPGTSDQTIASGQYLSGKQTIKGDANLLAENIKSGVTVFGVGGTYAGTGGLDTSDATAAADNIEEGKTAYVNGEKITGSLTRLYGLSAPAEPGFNESTEKIKLTYTNTEKRLFSANGTIVLSADASNFGDATAADVAAGKTFTSAAGLKVTGTNQGQTAASKICEVHPITIAELSGNGATIPLLTGNSFLAEHSADECLFVAFISLDNFTDKANIIHAIYQGNRPIATLNGNTNYGSFVTINSSTYTGKSWSNANCLLPINDAESFSATRLAVNESGDLNCYLQSSKYLDAGSYLAILVLAAA